jgi:hypothetical protein
MPSYGLLQPLVVVAASGPRAATPEQRMFLEPENVVPDPQVAAAEPGSVIPNL